mgnify:CR=1 FL=1
MLFNSICFLIFLPTVFILYWFVTNKNLKSQNLLLLVSSYIFYGWWDYRFLSLIFASTLVDFIIGKALEKQQNIKHRKILLGMSISFNLGLLAVFKYYNFFIESWVNAWQMLGVSMDKFTLTIVLPVGISFYTFQTLSYTIDVYRKQLVPTHNFNQFAAYVAFFPQLVAGPIERASNLLPQFSVPRKFNTEFAMSGVYLIIWGMFKKVVIADNCAFFVNQLFAEPKGFSSGELWLGAIFFGFQIYGDFSGYSDIAIGTARLFGFDLKTNFSFPYFSRDIAEFWRRWHISLSTWFRDYLYIPLGGSRGATWMKVRNVFIIFLVSGLWHGANWTFIVWGGLHAALFLPLLMRKKNRKHLAIHVFKKRYIFSMSFTFVLVTIAWVFFRADTVSIALDYILGMFKLNDIYIPLFIKTSKNILFTCMIVFSITILLGFEYVALKKQHKEVMLSEITAVFIGLVIVFFGVFKNPTDFIYFQF